MRRILDLPLLVNLIGLGAVAMLVPALHAYALHNLREARTFLYMAILFLALTLLLAFATLNQRPRRVARSHLISLLGAYLVLPLMLAVPFSETVRDTSFFNAWFEMLSCLTTTGMTLYEDPGRLSPTLHLWRGLVGWLGGFFIWVIAASLLAQMNLGGFEVLSEDSAGKGAATSGAPGFRPRETGTRMMRTAEALWPLYVGLTAVLWALLLAAGAGANAALITAMGTLSTSGIAIPGETGAAPGILGEVAVAAFLLFALSRTTFMNLGAPGRFVRLRTDDELRLAMALLLGVPALLLFGHYVTTIASGAETLWLPLRELWGWFYTALSFLTTTGYVSSAWPEASAWSGLAAPHILLLGLAIIGGGVATTAGGVKLLRIWALFLHSRRELERMIHPSSVGGSGAAARRLRHHGAEIAWIFFMLFAMSIALVGLALSLGGLGFDEAMVLSIAALSTTGPLAAAGETPIALATLGPDAKGILMAAMVLGRLETFAIIALLNPEFWRN